VKQRPFAVRQADHDQLRFAYRETGLREDVEGTVGVIGDQAADGAIDRIDDGNRQDPHVGLIKKAGQAQQLANPVFDENRLLADGGKALPFGCTQRFGFHLGPQFIAVRKRTKLFFDTAGQAARAKNARGGAANLTVNYAAALAVKP
jgi:hypothetical protein